MTSQCDSTMLTREKLDAIRAKSIEWVANKRDVSLLLDAALALLDIAELVPGEGELVERMRTAIARDVFDEAAQIRLEHYADLRDQLRRAEAERERYRADAEDRRDEWLAVEGQRETIMRERTEQRDRAQIRANELDRRLAEAKTLIDELRIYCRRVFAHDPPILIKGWIERRAALDAPPLEEKIDPRPTCVSCGKRWVPAEGVDATVCPCPECDAPPEPELLNALEVRLANAKALLDEQWLAAVRGALMVLSDADAEELCARWKKRRAELDEVNPAPVGLPAR